MGVTHRQRREWIDRMMGFTHPTRAREAEVAREIGIRPQMIRGIPQTLFDCFDVFGLCHVSIVR